MKHYSKVQKRKIINEADRTSDVKAGRKYGRSGQTIGRWRQELKMPHQDYRQIYFNLLRKLKRTTRYENL